MLLIVFFSNSNWRLISLLVKDKKSFQRQTDVLQLDGFYRGRGSVRVGESLGVSSTTAGLVVVAAGSKVVASMGCCKIKVGCQFFHLWLHSTCCCDISFRLGWAC